MTQFYLGINRLTYRPNLAAAFTNDPFFVAGEQIIVSLKSDRIEFKKPTLGYLGKTYKVTKVPRSTLRQFTFLSEINKGKYFFSEEDSTEDLKVIYLTSN